MLPTLPTPDESARGLYIRDTTCLYILSTLYVLTRICTLSTLYVSFIALSIAINPEAVTTGILMILRFHFDARGTNASPWFRLHRNLSMTSFSHTGHDVTLACYKPATIQSGLGYELWAYIYFEKELAWLYFYVKSTFTTLGYIKSLIFGEFFTAVLWRGA